MRTHAVWSCLVNVLLAVSVFSLVGCIKAKDYAGSQRGFVTLGVKQSFGEGAATKNYYLTPDGIEINVNDTKSNIMAKFGSPDSIEKDIDGYEGWTYKERKLKLFFDKDYLKNWSILEAQ
jgi:hypothetical protein